MIPKFVRRFPGLSGGRLASSYAGCYDVTPDYNPVIGPAPVPGLYLCAGFSGHGMQQSPAVGRAVAELIAYGAYRTLDLSPLALTRVFANRPLRELNVV